MSILTMRRFKTYKRNGKPFIRDYKREVDGGMNAMDLQRLRNKQLTEAMLHMMPTVYSNQPGDQQLMKKRNEKTSKAVASKAGRVLKDIDQQLINNCAVMIQLGDMFQEILELCEDSIETLKDNNRMLEQAKSIAASALTQAPDKKP